MNRHRFPPPHISRYRFILSYWPAQFLGDIIHDRKIKSSQVSFKKEYQYLLQITDCVNLALNRITYDNASWLNEWIQKAIAEEKIDDGTSSETGASNSPLRIVGNIRQISRPVFEHLLTHLPGPEWSFSLSQESWNKYRKEYSQPFSSGEPGKLNSQDVKLAVLESLSWLVRNGSMPDTAEATTLERLLGWLEMSDDAEVRQQIIWVLAHWPKAPAMLIQILLAQLQHHTAALDKEDSDAPAIYEALARLAARRLEMSDHVKEQILTDISRSGVLEDVKKSAQAALIHLLLAEAWKEYNIFHVFSKEVEPKEDRRIAQEAKIPDERTSIFRPSYYHSRCDTVSDILLNKLKKVFSSSDDPLHELVAISEPPVILTALLDAGVDDDYWESYDSYHEVFVHAARKYLKEHPELVGNLLARLREETDKPWGRHRMTLATLAAYAEKDPATLLEARNEQYDLIELLTRYTINPGSFNSRRFALTALSYLENITDAFTQALLVGCQDVAEVRRDAIHAAQYFRLKSLNLSKDSLDVLIDALVGVSADTASAAAMVLARIGTRVPELREKIITALVNAINRLQILINLASASQTFIRAIEIFYEEWQEIKSRSVSQNEHSPQDWPMDELKAFFKVIRAAQCYHGINKETVKANVSDLWREGWGSRDLYSERLYQNDLALANTLCEFYEQCERYIEDDVENFEALPKALEEFCKEWGTEQFEFTGQEGYQALARSVKNFRERWGNTIPDTEVKRMQALYTALLQVSGLANVTGLKP